MIAPMQKHTALVKKVYAHYRNHGRHHLPWRKTKNPYYILISELMLQQTQVDRVVPKYLLFIKTFPTLEALAAAPLSSVLLSWSGLGYNRRAQFLHKAAKQIAHTFSGKERRELFKNPELLEALPGVGHYTARAVAAFAANAPVVFVETNIRTVFFAAIHSSKGRTFGTVDNSAGKISDRELLPHVASALETALSLGIAPKDWYAALMDYGAYLKASGVKLNAQSAHYAKQSKFAGSLRQLRGSLLRALLDKQLSLRQLTEACSAQSAPLFTEKQISHALARLQKEGLIMQRRGRLCLPD